MSTRPHLFTTRDKWSRHLATIDWYLHDYLRHLMQTPSQVPEEATAFMLFTIIKTSLLIHMFHILLVCIKKNFTILHLAPNHGFRVLKNFFSIQLKYDLSENEYINFNFSQCSCAKCTVQLKYDLSENEYVNFNFSQCSYEKCTVQLVLDSI